MPRRRRNPRRSGRVLLVVALVVLAAAFGVVASTSFSIVQTDRTVGANVVNDGYGALKMDVVACVIDGKKSRMLTVTNLLGADATMQVNLQRSSIGTLYSKGGNGDSVTFSLATDETTEIDIKTSTGGEFPQTFKFDFSAWTDPLTMSGTRSVTIQEQNSKCDGTGTNTPPTADFTFDRKGQGSKVKLDGTVSSDPDGDVEVWEWDVDDDGTIDYTGKNVNANIPSGTEVTLVVTDDDGASDSVTKTV